MKCPMDEEYHRIKHEIQMCQFYLDMDGLDQELYDDFKRRLALATSLLKERFPNDKL